MLAWLAKNIGNILLSIVLAVIVWVIAVNEANPNVEDKFDAISVAFVNPPPDTIVYDPSALAVDVQLSAPQATLSDLSASVISATVDLSEAEAGRELYPVKVEPASISVTVEPRETADVPVDVKLLGETAPTYRMRRVVTEPISVTVTGPASWVAQVVSAVGEFSIQGASASVSQTVSLQPVDANEQAVPNVTIDPERAHLLVDIEQQAGFRDLTVKIELTGTQASGYRLVGVDVMPLSVTVVGLPAVLNDLPGFVATEPIDISGASDDFEVEASLLLPPGVNLYNVQTVRIRVRIEAIRTSLNAQIAPTAIGLPVGLTAQILPETLNVILEGPAPVLESIVLGQDVRVILDLTGLGVGTHTIEPTFETPEGVDVTSILPPSVQVTVERAPRGTRTPTSTPTPRPTP
jgi:YbbR domain-containing protein